MKIIAIKGDVVIFVQFLRELRGVDLGTNGVREGMTM